MMEIKKRLSAGGTIVAGIMVLVAVDIYNDPPPEAIAPVASYEQLLTAREDAIMNTRSADLSGLGINSVSIGAASAKKLQAATEAHITTIPAHVAAAAACINLAVNGWQPAPDTISKYQTAIDMTGKSPAKANADFQTAADNCLTDINAHLRLLPPSPLIAVSNIQDINNNTD